MQDFETTSTQSLMDRYYEDEKAQQERELTMATLNVRLDANDLAMLNIISKRFRKTRDDVAQELLASALIDLFSRLETTERKLLARDADEAARSLANEIAEENGVRNLEIKTGVWANHERQFTKIERKKAKLAEQQEAQQEESQQKLEEANNAEKTAESTSMEASNMSVVEDDLAHDEAAITANSEYSQKTQQDSQQSVASMAANQ